MGLDQYAYSISEENAAEGGHVPQFTWRKHSRLQTWMEALYTARTGLHSDNLNCGELRLTEADLTTLETAIREKALPVCHGGFFYGHQAQEEQADAYHDQDLAFCAWAKAEISEGHAVAYSCWW
ncbi:phosphoglycerate kinase [Paracoccus zhejiangensis]|uniref:Phosphoglycerate kinase n=1 Tax=Paracoccus zhejiangensis TaxID=1077935 RepID=A0A2H5F5K0_9RHOB|nr:phosphoglycerate kinase [Paracoccus zhejiangensis]AUH66831.1 phosphoglycerate kinase [Paracoccus zhejiangensis]